MGDLFSRLEALASGSSEAVLFLPRLSSFIETLIPSVGTGSDGGPRPPVLSPPGIFHRGLQARCNLEHLFQYRIFQTLREGGQTPNHLRLFSQSCSKSKLSEITSNKRQCVRLEDFLLVRQRGYCSGPHPRLYPDTLFEVRRMTCTFPRASGRGNFE